MVKPSLASMLQVIKDCEQAALKLFKEKPDMATQTKSTTYQRIIYFREKAKHYYDRASQYGQGEIVTATFTYSNTKGDVHVINKAVATYISVTDEEIEILLHLWAARNSAKINEILEIKRAFTNVTRLGL